ncbi:MAG: beta-galactosidase, partial [Armatimonadetes bacterium]|nr:beta-galactosidase [Armatimonadota bacterium]
MRSLVLAFRRSSLLRLLVLMLALSLFAALRSGAAPAGSAPSAKPASLPMSIRANVPHNMYFLEALTPSQPITLAIETTNRTNKPGSIQYRWRLTDYWGKLVRSDTFKSPPVTVNSTDKWFLSFHRDPDLKGRTGYYTFHIMAQKSGQKAESQTAFGVIPRPASGLKEKSMFGVSTNRTDKDALAALQKIGVKWVRTPTGVSWADAEPKKGTYEWDRFDRLSSEAQAHGLHLLPVIGNSPAWAKGPGEAAGTAPAAPTFPRDYADYVEAAVARYARENRAWELWDAPTVMGPTWKKPAQEYRDLLRTAYASAKKANPSALLLGSGGNPAFLQDVVFAPGAEASSALDALSAHIHATGAPEEEFYSQAEFTALLGRKYNKDRIWLTNHETQPMEPQTRAQYVPRTYVLAALAGATNLNWSPAVGGDAGLYGPGFTPTPAAVSYAVTARHLEDTLFVRDLWPHSRRIFGGVFKNSAGRKVAAVWAVGERGSLILNDAKDVQAYDVMGGETGSRSGDRLEVPFGEDVVYLASDMDQAAFIEKVQNARIIGISPVEIVAKPFLSPIALTPPVRIQVSNMLNRPIEGDVEAFMPKGWKLADGKAPFGPLEPGQVATVELPVRQSAISPENAYPVTISAESRHRGVSSLLTRISGPEWRVRRQQSLFLAGAVTGTPTVDGDLSDWGDALPVAATTREFISKWAPANWAKNWTPGNLSAQV